MRKQWSTTLLAALTPALLLGCGHTRSASPALLPHLAIVTNVRLVEGLPPALLDCDLEEALLEELENELRNDHTIGLVSSHIGVPGRVLALRISGGSGAWGGAITGQKSVTLEGRLLDNGEIVGSFTALRGTRRPGMMWDSTCAMVDEVLEELAEDVAEWARQPPTLGALLGEL